MANKYVVLTSDEYNNIRDTIHDAIEHVGSANSSSRELQAKQAIEKAFKTKGYVDPNDIKAN